MEVDEAVNFFASMPGIEHPLQLLKDVGLGYLTLGSFNAALGKLRASGELQKLLGPGYVAP
jgi:excinuclease ABC subunit A